MIFKCKIKLFLIIVFLVGVTGYAFFQYQINVPVNKSGSARTFIIESGTGVNAISRNLKDAGLIRSMFHFETYIWLRKSGTKIQAGEYLISPRMSARKIADIFILGEAFIDEVAITFPEGFTIKDMEERLKDNDFSEVNLTALKPYTFGLDFSFLEDITASNLEGFLFPDTYHFDRGWSSKQVATKMLSNFEEKITQDLLSEIKSQNKSLFEIITMASLIEREVRSDEDKKLVSGVLWKRLEIGMPLQVDASIVYLTGKETGKVLLEDLKIESPYNTYLNRGLPVGPISNPGLESIEAAISPQSSNYLYYLSKPTGETVFSRTLDEHNRAKAKYLK